MRLGRKYQEYIYALQSVISGLEQFCLEAFESELTKKVDLLKFRKFDMQEIYRTSYRGSTVIPKSNIRLMTISDGFFMLVQPLKDHSMVYQIERDPSNKAKVRRTNHIIDFR